MGNWVVFHRGTGTYFSIDDDAFAINVNGLDDEKFNDFFDEHDLDEIVDTHGFRLSDELFDEVFDESSEPQIVRIEVRGGVAELVESPFDVKVVIDDYDNEGR